MLVCMYECNMTDVIYYIDLVNDHGAIPVLLVYIALTMMFSMPLYMLLVFMSSYSKKSYLKFFSCSPLFEGLGYVIAVVKITGELFNTTLAGIALLIIYHFIVGRFKSTFCKGLIKLENDTKICLTMFPKDPHNYSCEVDEVYLLTATQYYIKNDVTTYKSYEVITVPNLNIPLLISGTVVWFIIFLMSVNGVRRIRKLTVPLQFVFGFIMGLIILISMFHGHARPPSQESLLVPKDHPLLSFDFWVDMILHTTYSNGFGSWIWLGTLMPRKLDPKFAIMVTSQVKLVIFALVSSMATMVVQDNLSHYKISDPTCLAVSGFHILFSFVPDVVYRTAVHKLAIPMWFTVLCYFSIISPLYSIMGLVDSFVQRFRILSKFKLYVCGIVCAICYAMNVLLMTDLGGYIMNCWRSCGMPILTASLLMLINIAIFWVYSGKEVVDDYLFTYGIPPEKYWIMFWKSLPIFSLFAFIFVAFNQASREDCKAGDYIVIIAYVQCSSMVIPIIVVFGLKCCRHIKYATAESISTPNDEWGPYDPNNKENRKYFRPERDIKYRSTTLKCKHRCSPAFNVPFQRKIELEQSKFFQLESEFIVYWSNAKLAQSVSIDSIDI